MNFIRRRYLSVSWYPLRGRRCTFGFVPTRPGSGRWFEIAVGPAYVGVGPGIPLP